MNKWRYEPDNAQWKIKTQKYDPCISPAKTFELYKKSKEKDPVRPYYLNLGQGVSNTEWIGHVECRGNTRPYSIANNGYLKGCEIASFDIFEGYSVHPYKISATDITH